MIKFDEFKKMEIKVGQVNEVGRIFGKVGKEISIAPDRVVTLEENGLSG